MKLLGSDISTGKRCSIVYPEAARVFEFKSTPLEQVSILSGGEPFRWNNFPFSRSIRQGYVHCAWPLPSRRHQQVAHTSQYSTDHLLQSEEWIK